MIPLNDIKMNTSTDNYNLELFKKISKLKNIPLAIHLSSENYVDDLTDFRKVTSKSFVYNDVTYPVVYLTSSDYGGLTFFHPTLGKLRLVVNLEFYYVYGIFFGDELYAFKGEAYEALEQFGFYPKEIPYGDAYFDIDSGIPKQELQDLKNTVVSKEMLFNSYENLLNYNISFDDKRKDFLIVFWSLIEGIRFEYISNAVSSTLGSGNATKITYQDFFNLAEQWADLCVAAAKAGKYNQDIAVYDLHRLEN